ncbi:hypothetical protein M0804_013358 [Polistes exclamans]|nr:hypothetical protein M0804_013358 [Polistes exclamans]
MYNNNISDIKYIDEQMMLVSLKLFNPTLNVISVYAPDITKTKKEKDDFYGKLKNLLDTTTTKNKTIILRDFNTRKRVIEFTHVIKHHELLHVKEAAAERATAGITSCCILTASEVHSAHVKLIHPQAPTLLLTAVVQLLDRDGRPHKCRVLLDSVSVGHFLIIRFANLLRIFKQDMDVPISGLNQTETKVR